MALLELPTFPKVLLIVILHFYIFLKVTHCVVNNSNVLPPLLRKSIYFFLQFRYYHFN